MAHHIHVCFTGDLETKKNITTFTVGTDILSQQNGNVWAKENEVVSLGLDGVLNVFDPRAPEGVRKLYVSFVLRLLQSLQIE